MKKVISKQALLITAISKNGFINLINLCKKKMDS